MAATMSSKAVLAQRPVVAARPTARSAQRLVVRAGAAPSYVPDMDRRNIMVRLAG